MASIRERKRANGETTYQITVSLGYDANGKKIQRCREFKPTQKAPTKRRKEVERAAAEFEEEVRNASVCLAGEKLKFWNFAEFWDEQYLAPRVRSGSMTQKCREDYMRALRLYGRPTLEKKKLSEISSLDIDMIVNKMNDDGKSPKTIRNTFNVFKNLFSYATRKRIISYNPCMDCEKLPKVTVRKNKNGNLGHFTEDEVNRFLHDALTKSYPREVKGYTRKQLGKNGTLETVKVDGYIEYIPIPLQYRVLFTLAVYSGCRRGELCALTWKDIDFESQYLRITSGVTSSEEFKEQIKDPKTEAGNRTLKLPKSCIDLLKQLKDEQRRTCLRLGSAWEGTRGKEFDDNFVFIQHNGKRMNLQTPTKKFKKILIAYNKTVPEELQLPLIRLHDLRHTNASHLIAQGIDVETVAKRLGHSKPSMTLDIYGESLNSMDDKAAAVLDTLFA